MMLQANWIISGIVTERRELTSEKNKSWRGYVCKLASLGATFEIQLTPEQYNQLADGQMTEMRGRFDEQQGRQRFVCDNFKEVKTS